jgi:hypothetical protein
MARRPRTPSDSDPIPQQQGLVPEPKPATHKYVKLSGYEKHKVVQVEHPDSAHQLICRELDDRLLLFRFKQVGVHDWQTELPWGYRWSDAQVVRIDWPASSASWSAHTVEMPGLIHTVTGTEIFGVEVLVPIDFQLASPSVEQPPPEPPKPRRKVTRGTKSKNNRDRLIELFSDLDKEEKFKDGMQPHEIEKIVKDPYKRLWGIIPGRDWIWTVYQKYRTAHPLSSDSSCSPDSSD